MRKKDSRTPQELCHYLAGRRDELRQKVKAISKDLARVEEELQAATFAAGLAQTHPPEN
ncbi:hypothetical protein [Geoalkalibacter sp.]|uniref:hypothetical protein n=1 Tax=Geoalkalibacter sp. TaxID=3041440 RepID=UPI00272E08A5|nr:hypothetical protein [Geoalkalibacter sp.]